VACWYMVYVQLKRVWRVHPIECHGCEMETFETPYNLSEFKVRVVTDQLIMECFPICSVVKQLQNGSSIQELA